VRLRIPESREEGAPSGRAVRLTGFCLWLQAFERAGGDVLYAPRALTQHLGEALRVRSHLCACKDCPFRSRCWAWG
jgi:hypothetical protein